MSNSFRLVKNNYCAEDKDFEGTVPPNVDIFAETVNKGDFKTIPVKCKASNQILTVVDTKLSETNFSNIDLLGNTVEWVSN